MTPRSRATHRPGRVLGAAALVSAMVVAVAVGPSSAPSLLATALGVVGLAIGLVREGRTTAGLGVLALLCGTLVAGGVVPVGRLLVAIAASVLALDFGLGSLAARDELRDGTVERAEFRHVFTATGAGVASIGVVYLLYLTVDVGASFVGVTLLFASAVALGAALRA